MKFFFSNELEFKENIQIFILSKNKCYCNKRYDLIYIYTHTHTLKAKPGISIYVLHVIIVMSAAR